MIATSPPGKAPLTAPFYIDLDMKYIDADKLIKAIEEKGLDCSFALKMERLDTLALIDELQQEQPNLPGIEENGIPGKDFIPVEWVDACEKYGKWKIVKVEQQEVDLEEEIDKVIADYSFTKTIDSGGFKTTVLDYVKIARHFFELGRNTGKEDKK